MSSIGIDCQGVYAKKNRTIFLSGVASGRGASPRSWTRASSAKTEKAGDSAPSTTPNSNIGIELRNTRSVNCHRRNPASPLLCSFQPRQLAFKLRDEFCCFLWRKQFRIDGKVPFVRSCLRLMPRHDLGKAHIAQKPLQILANGRQPHRRRLAGHRGIKKRRLLHAWNIRAQAFARNPFQSHSVHLGISCRACRASHSFQLPGPVSQLFQLEVLWSFR